MGVKFSLVSLLCRYSGCDSFMLIRTNVLTGFHFIYVVLAISIRTFLRAFFMAHPIHFAIVIFIVVSYQFQFNITLLKQTDPSQYLFHQIS